jgi:hypothetical protein
LDQLAIIYITVFGAVLLAIGPTCGHLHHCLWRGAFGRAGWILVIYGTEKRSRRNKSAVASGAGNEQCARDI